MAVGKVIIQASLATKDFDAKIEKLENRARQASRKMEESLELKELYSAQFDNAIDNIERYEKKIGEAQDEIESLNEKLNSLTGHKVITGDMITQAENIKTKMAKQQKIIEQLNVGLDKERLSSVEIISKLNKQENIYKKQQDDLELINNELTITKKKKDQINSDDSGGDHKGFGKWIKQVAKVGLAFVGLRTGLSMIRNSISTVSSQNDEIATKINTIKSSIANALTPVVETVVNLFARLLAYANYILGKWFGINMFAKDTANNTKKMRKNLGGANKEATKLKKTLAGFDEMNILQKDGGTTSGGGGGGGVANDIDTSMFDNIAIPEWVQWIADNKDTILTILKDIGIAIGVAFAIGKIADFVGWIEKLSQSMIGLIGIKVVGFLGGMALAIVGLYDLITSLNDGTATLNTILKDVGIAIAGVGLALVALNASNPLGWISLLIGGVTALVGAFTDEERKIKDVKVAQYDLIEAQEALSRASNELISATDAHDKAQANLTKTAKKLNMTEDDLLKSGKNLYELVANQEIKYKDLNDTDKLVYQTYVNMLSAEQRLEIATKNLNDANVTATQENLELARATAFSSKNFDEYGVSIAKAMENGSITAHEAGARLYEALQEMDEASRQTFVDNLPNDAKLGMTTFKNNLDSAMDGLSDKLPKVEIKFTANTASMSSVFNNTIKSIQNKLTFLKFPTIKSAKGSVLYGLAKGGILNLPRLAPGGIVNNPGPGVNYRGANIGERAPEAVVPLTDSQQMEWLGRTIGKYVRLQAEIPIYVGNRQIARELKNINADDTFAFNG